MTGTPFSERSDQPSVLITKSASTRSRRFLISQSTPLQQPPSSSAVSARMMSRSGLKPSCFMRSSAATMIASFSLVSEAPRP